MLQKFLFSNFNFNNVDLHSYSLTDKDLVTANSNFSVTDCMDEITALSFEIETENEEVEHFKYFRCL